MTDRKLADDRARIFFEDLWNRGDPWELETSDFERAKYDEEIAILNGRRYERTLEIGCGIGSFTRRLVPFSGQTLAIDISPNAISRAQAAVRVPSLEFRVQNIMDFDLEKEGRWDLLVLSETIYYLGWLYSFFDVAWLASQLFAATQSGGELLMANTRGGVDDYLLRPWIIRTYHDLFSNVGYELSAEKTFQGLKNGVQLEVGISLFTKP